MRFRKRRVPPPAPARPRVPARLGANVHLNDTEATELSEPVFAGVDWNYDTLGGLRSVPPANWLRDINDAPQQPSQFDVPRTIAPLKVQPIVGNHWFPVYYRTPPNNLVTDQSAHTGSPFISVTNGHYAKFMPPPVSLFLQHASRGENHYRIPPIQDSGTPVYRDYGEVQYTPWRGQQWGTDAWTDIS
jgi:hypothetical protein